MMNINLNVPLPRTDFKNVTAMKMREKLSSIKGEVDTPNDSEKKEDFDTNTDQKNAGQNQGAQSRRKPAWVKLLIWFIVIGVGLPVLTYLFDQVARVVKSARAVENAFS